MKINASLYKLNSGFTLIEVLVTLLVLSIGLLGLAGLQGQSLRANNQALERSAVTALANNMVNRILLNRAGGIAGNYDNTNQSADLLNPDCDLEAGCPAVDVAGHDLAAWEADLANILENGEGVVCLDTTPNDGAGSAQVDNQCDGNGTIYAIKIWWGPDGNRNQFVTSLNLQ